MFLRFSTAVLVAALAFPIVFSLLSAPIYALVTAAMRTRSRLLTLLAFAANVYFFSALSAFVAGAASHYASQPAVKNDWLYYVFGAMMCLGAFQYLARRGNTQNDVAPYLYATLASLAYFLFVLWPGLAHVPYGWLTGLFW